MVSYADFLTLLLALFVVLFASSEFDSRKSGTLASAFQYAFHAASFSHGSSEHWSKEQSEKFALNTKPLEHRLQSALATELRGDLVTLQADQGELTLSLKEVGFFDSGSATLRDSSTGSIARIAKVLMDYSNAVRVEGHTDNVPIGRSRFASNWELSSARAIEITRLLTMRFGINPARLSVAGFAQYKPVRSNSDSSGRAANRRVDIVIVGPPVGAQKPLH